MALDGCRLSAYLYRTKGEPIGNIIMAGATGVSQRFYKRFAEYACNRGYNVLTMDYRGIGESKGAALIFIDTPAIIHGRVERIPTTLVSLVETMSRRGVNVIELLHNALLENIPNTGIPTREAGRSVVILLRTPVVRQLGGPEERSFYIAFFLGANEGELGQKVGSYISHEGKYFAYPTGQADTSEAAPWKAIALDTVDVLISNDQLRSRKQSSVATSGPTGVLVGAGSLGSALLNIWGRNGWGTWTVIDNDHIKPHNLVRHTAYGQHIGWQKVNVVASLYALTTQGAAQVTPIDADFTSLSTDIVNSIQTSTLIVDASAGLECPRALSKMTGIGRAVSAFMSPDGNSAVLLAEDSASSIRLLSLEGQYYRAIINNDWGKSHLNGHLGTYWSGGTLPIQMALPALQSKLDCGSTERRVGSNWPIGRLTN